PIGVDNFIHKLDILGHGPKNLMDNALLMDDVAGCFKYNADLTGALDKKQLLITPPPLTSPPSAPTQPSRHSSPLAINLDPTELLFSTPPTSPQTLFDTLEDLPPTTTNLPPHRPSFDSIDHLANEPPPSSAMEPPLPPLPPQLLTFPLNPPSNFPPLPPLGPNNPSLC
nr:hypothetical protein [Tanacetum cinerariifolium]